MNKYLVVCVALAGMSSAGAAAEVSLHRTSPVFDPAPSFSWEGFYFGAHAGAVQAYYDVTTAFSPDFPAASAPGDFGIDDAAFAGGLQIGGNFQRDWMVYGFEGDLLWMDVAAMQREAFGGFSSSILTTETDWAASARGRIGAAFDRFSVYATAGLAVTDIEVVSIGISEDRSESQTHWGWTAGAGIEAAVASNISAGIEYRFSDYGKETYNLGRGVVNGTSHAASGDVGFQTHQITTRINYRFTGP